jgi:hypothetical protein
MCFQQLHQYARRVEIGKEPKPDAELSLNSRSFPISIRQASKSHQLIIASDYSRCWTELSLFQKIYRFSVLWIQHEHPREREFDINMKWCNEETMNKFVLMSYLVFLFENSEIDRGQLLTNRTDRLKFTEREIGSVYLSPAKKITSHCKILWIPREQTGRQVRNQIIKQAKCIEMRMKFLWLFFQFPLEYLIDWILQYLHNCRHMNSTKWSTQFILFHSHLCAVHEISNQESSENNSSLSLISSKWNANWGKSSPSTPFILRPIQRVRRATKLKQFLDAGNHVSDPEVSEHDVTECKYFDLDFVHGDGDGEKDLWKPHFNSLRVMEWMNGGWKSKMVSESIVVSLT